MKNVINYDFSKYLPIYIILKTYKNWRDDRTLRLGAGIAYYGVFAIIPIFTFMLGITAYFYSTEDIKEFVSDILLRLFGNELAIAINQLVDRVFTENIQYVFASVSLLGVVGLFIGASLIFVAFQDALDAVWKNDIRLGIKAWIKKYIWAYIVVLVSSSLLFLIFLVNSIGSALTSVFPGQFIVIEYLESILLSIATWIVGVLVLSVIYRLLIYKKISWRILIFASAVTSVLIFIGTWALGIYIRSYGGSSVGGALGAVLLLLVWVYYQAQIALIGAQFIKTLNENKKELPAILK